MRHAPCSQSLSYAVYTDLAALDRSFTAWESDRHSAVWEAMRVEFEVDDRVEMLNDRVGPARSRWSCCQRLAAWCFGQRPRACLLEAGCGQLLAACYMLVRLPRPE